MPRKPKATEVLERLAEAITAWANSYKTPRDFARSLERTPSGGSLRELRRQAELAIDALLTAKRRAEADLLRREFHEMEFRVLEVDRRVSDNASDSLQEWDHEDTDPEYQWEERYWEPAAEAADREIRQAADDFSHVVKGISATGAAKDGAKAPGGTEGPEPGKGVPPRGRKLPWQDDAPGFIPLTEAQRLLMTLTRSRKGLALSTLSERTRRQGGWDWMCQPGTGTKVHRDQILAFFASVITSGAAQGTKENETLSKGRWRRQCPSCEHEWDDPSDCNTRCPRCGRDQTTRVFQIPH